MTSRILAGTFTFFIIILLAIPHQCIAQKNQDKKKNSDVDNIGNRNVNKGNINLISIEKEIALGRQLAVEIERQVKLIQDPVINEFVNRIGQNLANNSDAKVPFTIKVIDSDEINAFALPGGFFYVNTGLILAAEDEAELAGVMAHEIAHVAARHGTENMSKAQLLEFATLPLVFLGGIGGSAIRQAAGFLIPLQFLQFSRKAEMEADYFGIQYLYKTGYYPESIITFFEKIQAREKIKPGSVPKMFSTHPPTADRIKTSKKNIETVLKTKEQYVVTTSEFQKVKNMLVELENVKLSPNGENKPSLRRQTRPPDTEKEKTKPEDKVPEEDERPTLKRRN